MSKDFQIEAQRGKLATARSILEMASFVAINDMEKDRDYGEILILAYKLVDDALDGLDSVELDRADKAQACADELRDAAEACTSDQAALRERLELAADVIDELLAASE